MTSEDLDLRKAGLKATIPRRKILQILENMEGAQHHKGAEDVHQILKDQGEKVGLATVYRVLTQFESAGLVVRHNFEGGPSVFELATDDHHDHMVCMESGEVVEFFDEMIEQRQAAIADAHGYELVDHSLVLYVRKKK